MRESSCKDPVFKLADEPLYLECALHGRSRVERGLAAEAPLRGLEPFARPGHIPRGQIQSLPEQGIGPVQTCGPLRPKLS